jgi:hypothetical protein
VEEALRIEHDRYTVFNLGECHFFTGLRMSKSPFTGIVPCILKMSGAERFEVESGAWSE